MLTNGPFFPAYQLLISHDMLSADCSFMPLQANIILACYIQYLMPEYLVQIKCKDAQIQEAICINSLRQLILRIYQLYQWSLQECSRYSCPSEVEGLGNFEHASAEQFIQFPQFAYKKKKYIVVESRHLEYFRAKQDFQDLFEKKLKNPMSIQEQSLIIDLISYIMSLVNFSHNIVVEYIEKSWNNQLQQIFSMMDKLDSLSRQDM